MFYENIRDNNGTQERRCACCNEWKPATTEYFYMKNKKKIELGLTAECKQCISKKSSKYQKENQEWRKNYRREYYYSNAEMEAEKRREWRDGKREHVREYTYEYLRNNPDKAKRYREERYNKKHEFNNEQWDSCKQYFNYQCAYCNLPASEHFVKVKGVYKLYDFDREHVDHDGTNDLNNCVPSCRSCNSRKWKFSLEDFYNESNPHYKKENHDRILKWMSEDFNHCLE